MKFTLNISHEYPIPLLGQSSTTNIQLNNIPSLFPLYSQVKSSSYSWNWMMGLQESHGTPLDSMIKTNAFQTFSVEKTIHWFIFHSSAIPQNFLVINVGNEGMIEYPPWWIVYEMDQHVSTMEWKNHGHFINGPVWKGERKTFEIWCHVGVSIP